MSKVMFALALAIVAGVVVVTGREIAPRSIIDDPAELWIASPKEEVGCVEGGLVNPVMVNT